MAVIRGESCFEKNAFEDTKTPTRPPYQNWTSGERISLRLHYALNVDTKDRSKPLLIAFAGSFAIVF